MSDSQTEINKPKSKEVDNLTRFFQIFRRFVLSEIEMLPLDHKQTINTVWHQKYVFVTDYNASKASLATCNIVFFGAKYAFESLLVCNSVGQLGSVQCEFVNKIERVVLNRVGNVDRFDRIVFNRMVIGSANQHAFFATNINHLKDRKFF